MLGAIVYILQAEEDGWLPEFTGRIMLGAMFQILKEKSQELAEFIHNDMNIKPFTVSELNRCQDNKKSGVGFIIKKGDRFRWRATVLHESLISILLQVPIGHRFILNNQPMVLKKIIMDGQEDVTSGLLDEQDLIAHCLSVNKLSQLKFDFISPTTFRVDEVDYPMPTPSLVFTSLARKWQELTMPLEIMLPELEESLRYVYIRSWQGNSKSVYLTPQRGINSFTGTFVYDISHLNMENRRLLLLLAQFGVFVGCGRLATQGMGRIKITYK